MKRSDLTEQEAVDALTIHVAGPAGDQTTDTGVPVREALAYVMDVLWPGPKSDDPDVRGDKLCVTLAIHRWRAGRRSLAMSALCGIVGAG